MKKIIFWLLSILFFVGSFCGATIFVKSPVINHSWLDYLCYSNWLDVYTWKTFPGYLWSYDYYSIPFSCWSFDTLNSFSPYFKFFTEYSWFLTNYFSASSSSFRFFSKSLNYFPAVENANVFSSFIKSSLTTSSTRNFISSNYLLKINLDNWEFLSYNPTNIQWFFYDNYFFSGVSLWYNNVVNSFYLPWVAASFVYNSSSWFIFQTIFSDWYSLNSSWKIVKFQSIYDDILTIPLLDFWYNYLTWSKTLLLKFYNNSLVYNILDCFTSKSSVLKSCSVIDKWYFSNYSDFLLNSWFVIYWVDLSVLYPLSSNNFFSFVYYNSWVLSSFYFPSLFGDIGATWSNSYYHNDYKNLIVSKKSFELTSNSSVFDILSTINFPISSWEVIDILDTLCNSSFIKPIFCNWVDQVSTWVDWFWGLDWSWNLIYTLINTDPNNMGWGDITPDWSWWFNVICSDQDWFWCPLLENAWLSWYLDYWSWFILGTDYYETFFQKTGRFFACPYWYVVLDTNSFLKILNKFNQISESIGFDFMLPINCSIAAFTHWKNYKFLKDVNLWLNPLMWQIQGPDDPRVYLYRFFDFLMSIALLFFLLKLYHLIF